MTDHEVYRGALRQLIDASAAACPDGDQRPRGGPELGPPGTVRAAERLCTRSATLDESQR
ncbi:hypothetical protein SANTM175S_05512 [Streptomyces antimycoticus]